LDEIREWIAANDGPPRWEFGDGIEAVVETLDLNRSCLEEWVQDWWAFVVDAKRLPEMCDYYERPDLGIDERFALMVLIIHSLDDAIGLEIHQECGPRVERYLRKDFELHFHTILYWTLPDHPDETDFEYIFLVTPLMRQIWRDCCRPEHDHWIPVYPPDPEA